ncbi:MAG: WecB/TagA/CpsF family glycosyltransferase [Planctomycetota bacterium]|jgi:N-acetylglucosaminyldiphosphoundecaprenol N-acetyl-beta-D-mannosaminyltransferase
MGVPVHAVTEKECVDWVADSWRENRGGWLHTVNLDHLRMIRSGLFFPGDLPHAELRVCDGAPLIWASRLQGTPLPERVAGSDLIRSLTQAAAKSSRRVFFLGGNPGSAEGAAARLQQEFPGFEVAGILCPDFGFEKDPQALAEITSALQESKADLVFVAVGAPKSERLIQEWKTLMPATWWAGVGISFSFVTGEVKRAPRWMQVTGLEWIHRLLQEPGRLSKRYLLHGLPFAARLFGHSIGRRFRRRSQ